MVEEWEIEQTSYRTWRIIDEEGDEFFVWADPKDPTILRCSCPYFTRRKRPRLCKHIRVILKRYYVKEDDVNE